MMIAVALDVKHGSFATASNADIFARDGSARLWDLNGNLLLTLKGHSKGVAAVTLDVEHGRLAAASLDGTARLWDLQGNLLQIFEGHSGTVHAVALDVEHGRFATTSEDKTARLRLNWSHSVPLAPAGRVD